MYTKYTFAELKSMWFGSFGSSNSLLYLPKLEVKYDYIFRVNNRVIRVFRVVFSEEAELH